MSETVDEGVIEDVLERDGVDESLKLLVLDTSLVGEPTVFDGDAVADFVTDCSSDALRERVKDRDNVGFSADTLDDVEWEADKSLDTDVERLGGLLGE